jgi:hypothetical protein
VQVQRATRAGLEAGPVEEHARVLVQAGAPLALAGVGPHALLQADFLELPLVVAEPLGQLLDVLLDLLLRLVRAVGATALDQLGRGLGEHALAALAEDAVPRRHEERDVDLPLLAFLAGDRNRDPLARRCHDHVAVALVA